MEEEIKTLKDNIEFLHQCLDDRDRSIKLLQEQVKVLNERLDNKEKVNKQLREEIQWLNMKKDDEEVSLEHILELEEENKKLKKYYDRGRQELADSLYDEKKENKKLKEDLQIAQWVIENHEEIAENMRKEIEKLKVDIDLKDEEIGMLKYRIANPFPKQKKNWDFGE